MLSFQTATDKLRKKQAGSPIICGAIPVSEPDRNGGSRCVRNMVCRVLPENRNLATIMRHFYIPLFALSLWTMVACGSMQAEENHDAPPLPDAVMVAEMYGHYINGEFDAYVGYMESLDHVTEEYRSQMAALFKQRHRAQVEENGGPIACRLIDVKPNDSCTYAEVYVEVTFKDRTYEEIMLPMVRVNDVWRLR